MSSRPLYCEVQSLAAMLESEHPCPPDFDLDGWINQELTELAPLHLRRRTLIKVIENDYFGMLIDKSLEQTVLA